MNEYAVRAFGLTRYFGRSPAVDRLDLAVPRGSVFALVGRNGSGKTTTIRMLLGLLRATRGASEVLGCPSPRITPQIRARIGYLAESHVCYGWMTIRQAESFQRAGFPTWSRDVFHEVVEYFGLSPEQKVRALSRGERAGLCLALTLAPEPELLVLDDPALGLDPFARRALVEALLRTTRRGDRTVLFSSHYLDDVERVADRIAIIDRGVLRVHARVDEFRERVASWRLRFERSPPHVPAIKGLVRGTTLDDELRLTVANPDATTETTLRNAGALSCERVPLSLENAVLDYLQERGRNGTFRNTAVPKSPGGSS